MQAQSTAERGIGRYARDLTAAILDASKDDEFILYAVEGMPWGKDEVGSRKDEREGELGPVHPSSFILHPSSRVRLVTVPSAGPPIGYTDFSVWERVALN